MIRIPIRMVAMEVVSVFLLFLLLLLLSRPGESAPENISSTKIIATSWSGQSCDKQWHADKMKNATVTFIVPSQGRRSLVYTLNSLFHQTDSNWLAVIIFDGVASHDENIDSESNIPTFLPRFDKMFPRGQLCFQHRRRVGTSNCAGEVRNAGIGMSNTPWIGFVDDDDSLHEQYVATLRREVSASPDADADADAGAGKLDAVIFRMTNGKSILPTPGSSNFYLDGVGISYAVRRSLWTHDNYSFVPSITEDYILLHRLRADGRRILLSSDVMYFVKNQRLSPALAGVSCPRAIITNDKDPRINSTLEALGGHWHQATSANSSLACQLRPKLTRKPVFLFAEERSIIFGNNVRGLNESLTAAVARGCLDNWKHGYKEIEILFSPAEKGHSPLHIQVQMEQLHSKHFNAHYVQKLNSALQVWEFSPSQVTPVLPVDVNTNMLLDIRRFPMSKTNSNSSSSSSNSNINRALYTSPSYFVPSLLTASKNIPTYDCLNIDSRPKLRDTRFHMYRLGAYRSCRVHADGTVENGNVVISPDCVGAQCNKTLSAAINNDANECAHAYTARTSVLSFGLMQGSFRRQREIICDDLQAHVGGMTVEGTSSTFGPDHVLCLTTTFESTLEHFVCKADIVVVEHYFEHSALETHRIDPLIQAKKLVYVTPSADPALDAMYASYVHVVPRTDMASQLKAVLHHEQLRGRSEGDELTVSDEVMVQFEHVRSDLDPLCHALRMLSSDFAVDDSGTPRKVIPTSHTSNHHHSSSHTSSSHTSSHSSSSSSPSSHSSAHHTTSTTTAIAIATSDTSHNKKQTNGATKVHR